MVSTSIYKKLFAYFGLLPLFLVATQLNAQSGSYGNTYVDGTGVMAIYAQHNFQSGTIVTKRTSPQGYVTFVPGSSWIGATNAAHVDGYVSKIGNTAFVFPVGDPTTLRTLSISAPTNASTQLGVAWFSGNPSTVIDPTDGVVHNTNLIGPGLTAVSPVGFWDWVPFIGSNVNGLTVTASIPDVSGFSSAANLRLVGWNGLAWIDLSGSSKATGNTNGSTLTGTIPAISTITAIAIGTYNPITDLAVTKVVDKPLPVVGSNVVFTVVATNNGPNASTGVTVTDLLGAGYTYISSTASSGTSYASATGLWTIGGLTNAASATLTITASVNATGPYANTATVTGNENDLNQLNNTVTITPVPVPSTDRAIVKTINNQTPAVGSTVIFTLNATNNGPSATTGVVVTDILPSGYTYVSSTPPVGTTYIPATGLWTIGAMTNGATRTLTITAIVNAIGSYVNTASIAGVETDPVSVNNTSSVTPIPTPVSDRSIVKTVNNSAPAVGTPVVFTLIATNSGPSTSTGVTVTDLLPAGYTYVSSTPPIGTTYTSGTGVWNIGTLPNGANATLTITATVKATGPYANTATITGTESDPTPGNNSSTVTPIPVSITDRSIVKTVNNATPVVGSNVIFTLVARNNGPSNGTGIAVTDLLPAGYTYVSSTPPIGTTYNSATGIWNIGSLANETNSTLTITATVNASGSYANTATINGIETDLVPLNNSSTATTIPIPSSDRSLVKTIDNQTPPVGSTVIFTLNATNNGPSPSTGVVVTDILPNGYSYVSSTPPAGTTYTPVNGLWTIGTMTNGATRTLTITATVNATGTYTNTGVISGIESDPISVNNTSSVTPIPTAVTNRSIVKTVNNTTPAVGSNVVFTLVATNNGPSTSTGITVTDLLPAGYTYVSSTPPIGTTYTSGTGVWNIGTLANGANATLTITATVNAAGPYANTASINGNENDPTPGNNTSTITPIPVPTTDRSIVKTVDNATPAVGNNVVFTLVARNNGPSNGTGITVTDILPAGYTYVSSTPPIGTTYNSTNGIWNIGTLSNGASSTITITATVNATGSYANTATINGVENDPTPGNNTSTTTPIPVPTTDRSLVKTINNQTPAVGSTVIFTLIATNNGPSPSTGVVVTDILPSGYTYVSSTPPAGTTYVPATGLWTIGNMANGNTKTLTITATVNATGNYTNTASINGTENDPTPGNSTSTVTPVPTSVSDQSIVKTVNNTTPAVGSNVVFTLVATNNGPSASTGIIVTDLLPAGYTYVSSTPPIGTTYASGTGVWNIGTLANGANATLTITATVNATGSYANTASINGNENDPTPGNNTSTITPNPTATTNRSIVKTVNNTTPAVGSNVVFTLVATNNGPSASTGVTVTDLLPAGYTYVSSTPPAGTTYTSGTGIWNIGTLANGANATLTITATVNATGPYANTASINGNENDPTPGNNTSTITPIPTATTDRSIVKTVDNSNPTVGNTVIFRLLATNNGPSDGTGITVTDLLPAGYTYVSSDASEGTTYTSGTGVWNIGALSNGATTTLYITATVNASGPYANTATINGTENDPTPGNNSSTITPTPVASSNLNITKTVDTASPYTGNNVVFTLTASNAGPSNATGVSVNDLLPSGYTFVSATPSAGTYNSGTGVWSLNDINANTNATLTITATVNPTGNYTNTATINADQNDPTPDNNMASVTPTPINVQISKTGPSNSSAGNIVTYTLTANNSGTGNALAQTISDNVSASLVNVSWTAVAQGTATISNGATGTGNTLSVTGDIPSGSNNQIIITITGTVPSSSTVTSISNTASVTATGSPIITSNTITTTIGREADIQIQKTGPTNAYAGNLVDYNLTITNLGPADANAVTIEDMLPAGLDISTVNWTATALNGANVSGASSGTGNVNLLAAIPATGNASISVTITGKINGDFAGSTLVNTATATPETGVTDATPASSSVTTNVSRIANVRITKSGPANIGAGDMISYTLRVINDGPSNAPGINILDNIPSQVLNPTWTATVQNGATLSAMNGTGNINLIGDIPATTGVIEITVTGLINPATPDNSNFSNTATANFQALSPVTDPELANNTSTIPTVVSNSPLLRVSKNGPTSININDPITYTIVVSNGGAGDITDAIIQDNVPTSVIVSDWNIVAGGGATITGATSGTTNTVATSGDIPADGNPLTALTIVVHGTVSSNALSSFTNTVTVTAGNVMESSVTTSTNQSTDLIIQKSGPQTATAGTPITYSIKVSNAGPVDVQGLTIQDLIPSDVENINWTATASGVATINGISSGSSNTIQLTGNITAGASNYITIAINGTVSASTSATTISNNATVTSSASVTDYNLANNSSSVSTTIIKETDVSITKTVDNTMPNVGSNVVFTLVATNSGPSDGTGISVTDLLPAGYTFVSATPPTGTSYVPATGLWTIGALTNGASSTLTITATVAPTGSYANTASINGTENDPTPGNNSSTITPTPIPNSDRSIVKTVDNQNPAVGSTVTFSLLATNNGPSDGTGVTVTDLLPSGYTYVSSVAPIGTIYNPTNGLWNIGTLAGATTSTLTITATVNAAGTYANTASISGTENDPTPGNDSSTSTPTAVPTSDRTIVKTVDNSNPAVGSTVTFSLAATNNGPSNGTGVTVTDLLPAGYTYVSSIAPIGTSYDSASGLWTIGTLTAATTATLTITATVNPAGPYANTASISGTENDPTPGNDSSTSTPTAVPTSDRSIVKTVDNSNPAVGSTVTFSLAATNNGPSNGTGVTVTDLLPAGYTYVSSVAPIGTTYDSGSGEWTIGTLAGATTATLTITATVNKTGPYANTASITGTENDPTPGNDSSSSTPTAVPTSDRSIVKTVDNPNPAVGSTVTFSLAATNNGPSDGTGVTVTDLLPAGYTYISSVAPIGTSYDPASGKWNIGTLAGETTATLTITATVNKTGPYANSASIDGTENDPTPGNDSSTSTPIAVPTSDRSIVKTVDHPNPAVGSTVTFSLAATNNGPSDGTGVTVTDLLPAGYTYVSSVAPIGTTYDPGSGEWTIGTLAGATTATLSITATVNATGSYANSASITGTENDPTPGNDSSTSTPTPSPRAHLTIAKVTKTPTQTSFVPGQAVVYKITVTNDGPSEALAVNIQDVAPMGTTISSWTAIASTGVTYPNASGTGNLDETLVTLANGLVAIYEVTVQTPADFTGTLSNAVTTTSTTPSPTPDPTPGPCTTCATNPISPTPQADLNTVKTLSDPTQTSFVPGQAVVYRIAVTNNGPSDATAVSIVDNAPAGTTISSWTAMPSTGVTYPNASGTGNLNESLATLTNGLVAIYEVTVQTPADFTGTL
ncbi:hypothetical protein ACFFUQ_05615, partial [Flavobacterium branchiarum]